MTPSTRSLLLCPHLVRTRRLLLHGLAVLLLGGCAGGRSNMYPSDSHAVDKTPGTTGDPAMGLDALLSAEPAPAHETGALHDSRKMDGKVAKPDQKVVKPDQKVVKPDQKVVKPDQKVSADTSSVCSASKTCSVNLTANTTTCSGTIAQQSLSGGQGVFKTDLTGCTTLEVSLYLCNPTSWVFHIGDSPSNDGYGGDGGDFSNDAELQLLGTTLAFYPNDYTTMTPLLTDSSFVSSSGCATRTFTIKDSYLATASPAHTVSSVYGFRLNAADSEGTPDAIIYVGLNRTVGSSSRTGTGIQTATITIK
jgi:hypothetical protein